MRGRRTGTGTEVHRGEDWREGEAIAHKTTAGVRVANVALEGQNVMEDCPRAGQLLQQALGQGANRMMGNINVQVEAEQQMTIALKMTP